MEEASTRPNSTVYVGGLDTKLVTATTLSEVFIPFGEIVNITLPKPEAPSSTELHRGFGYVEFEDATDAKEAIDNMDQSELFGRVIKVAMAKPDQHKTGGQAGVGAVTAIWEQEGYLAKFGGGGGGDADGGGLQGSGNAGHDGTQAQIDTDNNVMEDSAMHGLEGLDVAGPKPK